MIKTMADNGIDIKANTDAALYHALSREVPSFIVRGFGSHFGLSATSLSVKLGTGVGVIYGRHIYHDGTTEVTCDVPSNTSGYIVLRFNKNNAVGNETTLEAVSSLYSQDVLNSGSIYDLPLAKYTSSASTVTIGENLRVYLTKDSDLLSSISSKEPKFTKNSAFNKNFGKTAGTVMQGNDERVLDAVSSKSSGIGSTAPSSTNLLATSPNLSGYVEHISGNNNEISNLPIDYGGTSTFGKKVQYTSGSACVLYYEHYPQNGRIWLNTIFNGAWQGWKLIAGTVLLSVAATANGGSIKLLKNANTRMFSAFDVYLNYSTNPIRIPNPQNVEVGSITSVTGSSIGYVNDTELELFTLNMRIEPGTVMNVNSAKNTKLSSGKTTNATVVRVVGLP